MKKALGCAGIVFGWMVIALAAFFLIFQLPELYLLLTGQVAPGAPSFMGDPAPTVGEALIEALVLASILAAGFVLKELAGRVYRKKTA